MKRGNTSFRYHSSRAIVFTTMLPSCGRRTGGSSRMKSELFPGNSREASQPTVNRVRSTTPNHTKIASRVRTAAIPISTPSWAEQGTPSASSRVVCIRSFRVSRIRVVSVAMVSQPSPSTIGSTALPFRPIAWKGRLAITASRGRYPESSRMLKARKKVSTIGMTMAIP